MTTSFALSPATWDLTLDSTGNLALLTGPNALAQDVACAISTFLGEMYYDTTQGIPWLSQVFGQQFSPSLVSSLIVAQVLQVPGVVSNPAPKVEGLTIANRKVSGTVNFTDSTGQSLGVAF